MTLEQLLDCDAVTLEAMTDEQLLTHFKPFLNVTRPELAPKKRTNPDQPIPFVIKQKMAKLQALGIDLDFMQSNRKRK